MLKLKVAHSLPSWRLIKHCSVVQRLILKKASNLKKYQQINMICPKMFLS